MSIERGRHLLKVGGEVRHYRSDGYNHVFPRGQLNFCGAYTGSGIGDLLLGMPPSRCSRTTTTRRRCGRPPGTCSCRTTGGDHAAHHQRGAAIRVQQTTGGCGRPHGIFDPGVWTLCPVGQNGVPRSGIARTGTTWRRASARAGGSRRRLVAAPRRLRDLLRQQHAHRELGALLQPSVLHLACLRAGGPLLPTAANPFPEAEGFRPTVR